MGKDWMSPEIITESSRIFAAFSLVLTGVAVWDVLSTLWFDWQIITGKRHYRWPMLLYFVARISMLLHIFAVTINRNALHEVPCSELIFMSKFCDAVGTCISSLILVLRTLAVWHGDRRITLLLGLLFAGQIAEWLLTFRFSEVKWNPSRRLFDVLSTAPRPIMISVWAYTMAFDFIVLLLCTYQLGSQRSSTIGNILLRDGILYFCFAFAANLIQTVMAGLQLNPIMNIITLPFALVVSVIAATRVFRNVFVMFDNFSGDLNGPDNNSGLSGPRPDLQTSTRIVFNHGERSANPLSANEIPLNGYLSHSNPGETSLHKGEISDADREPLTRYK